MRRIIVKILSTESAVRTKKQISISIPVSVSTRLVRFNVFRTLLMEPGLKLTGKENICRVNAALSTMRKMETGGG